ncbi:hypothetical protein QE152_g13371 [Popillia japonica]|uniref:Uncharacterized protein n=1 Tax=Popillia japonica TaxID=7064 RepID=A0AAW1LA57_POPJA
MLLSKTDVLAKADARGGDVLLFTAAEFLVVVIISCYGSSLTRVKNEYGKIYGSSSSHAQHNAPTESSPSTSSSNQLPSQPLVQPNIMLPQNHLQVPPHPTSCPVSLWCNRHCLGGFPLIIYWEVRTPAQEEDIFVVDNTNEAFIDNSHQIIIAMDDAIQNPIEQPKKCKAEKELFELRGKN